jgi:hypothetical protein
MDDFYYKPLFNEPDELDNEQSEPDESDEKQSEPDKFEYSEFIGELNLNGRLRQVKPMHDFYINWLFENYDGKEIIKNIVNIFIEEHKRHCKWTPASNITGSVKITTQYAYYLNPKTNKYQDIKLEHIDSGAETYIEFQNKANLSVPVSTRAIQYWGLSVGHNQGKDRKLNIGMANQIWLLAESVPDILHGGTTELYYLKGERTYKPYPNRSWMMFLDLSKMADYETDTGEEARDLAEFFLGRRKHSEFKRVQEIILYFINNFNSLKKDKEALSMFNYTELKYEEQREEGKFEGIIEVAKKMLKRGALIKDIIEDTGLSKEQVNELATKLKNASAR